MIKSTYILVNTNEETTTDTINGDSEIDCVKQFNKIALVDNNLWGYLFYIETGECIESFHNT